MLLPRIAVYTLILSFLSIVHVFARPTSSPKSSTAIEYVPRAHLFGGQHTSPRSTVSSEVLAHWDGPPPQTPSAESSDDPRLIHAPISATRSNTAQADALRPRVAARQEALSDTKQLLSNQGPPPTPPLPAAPAPPPSPPATPMPPALPPVRNTSITLIPIRTTTAMRATATRSPSTKKNGERARGHVAKGRAKGEVKQGGSGKRSKGNKAK